MRIVIPVYFDYASSLCYVAWRVVAPLEADVGVTLDWRGVQISAQYPQWKPGTLLSDDLRANITRVARQTGVALRIPGRWMDSRAALEGTVFAAQHGRATWFRDAVFQAAYERGEDIADQPVLGRIAETAGVPVGGLMEAVVTRRGAPEVAATLQAARAHGIVGYPTFLLGELPLTGIQPYATMKQLITRHVENSQRRLH